MLGPTMPILLGLVRRTNGEMVMRNHRQKAGAERKYLLENKFTRDDIAKCAFPQTVQEQRCQEATFAFSAGWDEAQKWEVSEDQRQNIAVQAMIGLLSGEKSGKIFQSVEHMAEYAYKCADAMIKARKK